MHRCLQIQDVLSIIFQCLPRASLAWLARTCTTFRDPALDVLWRDQCTLLPLLKCLPKDSWAIQDKKFKITRNLTASDFERIYLYCHRIRSLSLWYPISSHFEAQVLPMIWSRKPSRGPLLCNLSAVILHSDDFKDLAIFPRLVIGPHIRTIKIDPRDSFSWANLTAVLKKAAPTDLSSFMLRRFDSTLSWSVAESLELLLILRGAKTLDTGRMFLTSHAISLIATFPALEDLKFSVTEREMEGCTASMVGNSFQTITSLAIRSDSDNACQMMLMQIQSRTCRSLELNRTSHDTSWDVGKLSLALHVCNMASSLESLHVCNDLWKDYGSFNINARALKHLHSFEQLRDLSVDPSSVDLCDNDLLELAKSLPQLRSLVFSEHYVLNNQPNCTFIGMQHVIQFCPHLQKLDICVDARQIPIFATQPDGEYPIGFHLTSVNLRNSPVSNACDVASYLIMLLPVLRNFDTAYSDGTTDYEEGQVDVYQAIWLEAEQLL